jgi:hypothetical protein
VLPFDFSDPLRRIAFHGAPRVHNARTRRFSAGVFALAKSR